MTKYVYDFTEGNEDLRDLLGGKGANLAEMTNLGLPVPPGFTITTDACRHFLWHGSAPGRTFAAREHLIAHTGIPVAGALVLAKGGRSAVGSRFAVRWN